MTRLYCRTDWNSRRNWIVDSAKILTFQTWNGAIRSSFIEISSKCNLFIILKWRNNEFECLDTDSQVKLLNIYNAHFTGSSLWDFQSVNVNQLLNGWNVNLKIICGVPFDTQICHWNNSWLLMRKNQPLKLMQFKTWSIQCVPCSQLVPSPYYKYKVCLY